MIAERLPEDANMFTDYAPKQLNSKRLGHEQVVRLMLDRSTRSVFEGRDEGTLRMPQDLDQRAGPLILQLKPYVTSA